MAERFTGVIWGGLARFVRRLFALDPGPADLAEEVADRLFDPLTPDERIRIRQRFGVDPETNATLEEFVSPIRRGVLRMPTWRALFGQPTLTERICGQNIAELAVDRSTTRRFIRDIESRALIRLYRWDDRKALLPAVQHRLIQRIVAAHETILEALCGAPPVRPVLVGWHDQLVDGRRSAGEIAAPPDPVIPDDPEDDAPTSELVLAAKLRKALWAHAKGRKAARQQDEAQAGRGDERAKALELFLAARFNAQSVRAMAESLLGHARRMAVASDEMTPQLLDPAEDRDGAAPPGTPPGSATPWRDELPDILGRDPALADAIVEESGMPVDELWEQAVKAGNAIAKAERNLRLLADAGMPLVAETAVGRGLRGKAFFDGIERGRAALLHLADRFCFAGAEDFTAAAEQVVRAALKAPE